LFYPPYSDNLCTMELKIFIKETLTQIIEGIDEAQKTTENTGAIINPNLPRNRNENYYQRTKDERLFQSVAFDVNVTVVETSEKKKGMGVNVFAIHLGSDGEKLESNTSTSRISFTVPVILPEPVDDPEKPYPKISGRKVIHPGVS